MRRLPWSRRSWLTTAHLAVGLVVPLVTGTVMVTLLSIGIGLLVVVVGVAVLALAAVVAHWCARFELLRIDVFLDEQVRLRPFPPRQPSLVRTAGSWAASPAVWLQSLHPVLRLAIGPVVASLAAGTWALGISGTLYPAYRWALPEQAWSRDPLIGAALTVGGVLALFLAPWVAEGLARADVAMARGMLGTDEVAELSQRVTELRETRAAVVDAADEERRRIERDLHDGAQQQLVSLAMTLGLAKTLLDDDPEGAKALVDQAHGEAKLAITELRNVVRGVFPAVLTDRGLDAALSALAARSPVPVRIEVDVHDRPSPTVEAVAYFVVAECLTNVAKHAQARGAVVTARRGHGVLRVEVADDGRGGADQLRGTGLRGLADRVAAVDGRLDVHSPPGGGTLVTVEIPCP